LKVYPRPDGTAAYRLEDEGSSYELKAWVEGGEPRFSVEPSIQRVAAEWPPGSGQPGGDPGGPEG